MPHPQLTPAQVRRLAEAVGDFVDNCDIWPCFTCDGTYAAELRAELFERVTTAVRGTFAAFAADLPARLEKQAA